VITVPDVMRRTQSNNTQTQASQTSQLNQVTQDAGDAAAALNDLIDQGQAVLTSYQNATGGKGGAVQAQAGQAPSEYSKYLPWIVGGVALFLLLKKK